MSKEKQTISYRPTVHRDERLLLPPNAVKNEDTTGEWERERESSKQWGTNRVELEYIYKNIYKDKKDEDVDRVNTVVSSISK